MAGWLTDWLEIGGVQRIFFLRLLQPICLMFLLIRDYL